MLGFPADARVLLLNADDLGLHPAVNAAVIASIEAGIAASCSLMTPTPGAPDAIRRLRDRPEIPFGVHLTLVCDLPRRPWGPLAGPERVPSLLDESGRLYPPGRRAELLARARIEDVEREFRAQVAAVADAGLTPAHLDWHCLADGGREDVFDLTVSLADEYGLAVRAWLEPAVRKVRRRGLPAVDHDFLDSFALDLDGKAARYAALLRGLPPGLSEWAVHPGSGDAEARAAEPDGWRVRATDHAFLTSPAAREIVRQEGIEIIGYRTVREAWARARPGARSDPGRRGVSPPPPTGR